MRPALPLYAALAWGGARVTTLEGPMDEPHGPEFIAWVVRESLAGKRPLAEIAAENGISPDDLLEWNARALEAMPSLFERKRSAHAALEAEHEAEVRKLRAEIDRLAKQIDWITRKTSLKPTGPDEP